MGNLCDKSIHISVLLIVLCVGVLCGLIFYILIDQEVGEDVSKNTTQPFLCKTTTVSLPKIASLRRAMLVTSSIKQEEVNNLLVHGGRLTSGMCPAELASEKNQVMDKLLNQPQMPSDYGDVMIGLYRDKSQDVLTRDFAVQHIGLYAQALERRGEYDAEAAESRKLRSALFDAAGETRTIIAAAAFRALADMSVFDPKVDTNRLDSLLAACTADASSDPASRSMAVQLCGERRVKSSRPALESIRSDPTAPEILRRSANYSLALIAGTESSWLGKQRDPNGGVRVKEVRQVKLGMDY